MKAYLCIKLVKDVLQVVTLDTFFGIEQFKELLDELRGNEDLELADLNGLIDYKLQKEFIDSLQVWPSGIHFLILVDTRL
jgi:hypothetical protein